MSLSLVRGAWAPCLLLLAARSFGAENGSAPAPADPTLAGVQRDLSDLKAPGSLDPKAELPRLDLPAMPSGVTEGPRPKPDPAAALDANGHPKKSANWLVDAMERSDPKNRHPVDPNHPPAQAFPQIGDRTAGAADEGRDPVTGALRLAPEGEAAAAPTAKETAAERDHAAAAREAAQTNPLTPFMGSWISAADRSLLVPSAGDNHGPGPAGGTAAGPATGPDPASLPAAPDLAVPLEAPPGTGRSFLADGRAPANPYLEQELAALALPGGLPGLAPAYTPATPPVPAAPATIPGLEPLGRPGDAAKFAIPDFAKPSDDDKYFKQMKRF